MSNHVLFYADIHHGTLIGKVGKNDIDLRVEDALDVERQITQYCVDNNIDTVVFCGDRFRSRNPPVWLFNMVEEVWADRVKKGIEIFAIAGNHDQYRIVGHGSNYSVLWAKEIASDRVHVFENPTKAFVKGHAFGFIPFGFGLWQRDWSVDVLVFHDEIDGFKDDRGYVGRSRFTQRELSSVSRFFLGGHIHAFADLHGQGLIIGSPYQMDMLDVGIRKGFIDIDLETLEYKFVETAVPKMIKIDVVEETSGLTQELVEGNYIYCRASKLLVEDAKEMLKVFKARAYRVDEIVDKGMFVEAFARKVYESSTVDVMIKEYLESRDVVGKEELARKGMEVWKQVAG